MNYGLWDSLVSGYPGGRGDEPGVGLQVFSHQRHRQGSEIIATSVYAFPKIKNRSR